MAEQSMITSYPFGGFEGAQGITLTGVNKYPNPFYDVASEYCPRDINTILEWCNPAGTMITRDTYGRVTPVEQLKPGDTVLTRDGTVQPVEIIGTREIKEDIVEIAVAGMQSMPLRITADHPVYIWRPTSTLKPNRLTWSKTESEVVEMPAGEVQPGDWVQAPDTVYDASTKDWWLSPFICGMFVAEGCYIKQYLTDGKQHMCGVQFTLGSHEIELRERLVREISEYGGKQPSVITHHTRPDIANVRLHDPIMAAWLFDNFGEYSHNKVLPEALFHLPREAQLEFFGAWIDGDGNMYSRTPSTGAVAIQLWAVSSNLAYQGVRLAQGLGLNPTLIERPGPASGFGGGICYGIIFNAVDSRILIEYAHKGSAFRGKAGAGRGGNGTVRENGKIYRKVYSVTRVPFEGKVYKLQVANNHNYVAQNILVRNCEYLFMSMGTYRSAARRVVRYFLTELVLESDDEKEKDKYEKFLNDELHLLQRLADIGDDLMVYGNVFISVYFPFDRWLICPECHTAYHCETIDYQFHAKDGTFQGVCPKCDSQVVYKREDRRSPETKKVKIMRWNPKMIKMRVHPISGHIEYYLEMEQNFVEKLRSGDKFFLNQTPWSMVEASVLQRQKGEPVLFKFRDDVIYHFKDSSLSGIPIKGWAIPPIMPNFKLVYYIAQLRRYDEAIMLDFTMPFRVISPQAAGSSQGQDPLSSMSMGNFIGAMKNMIDNKRKYMTDIQVAPFPLEYQMLGGEAKDLAPKENMAQALDELLNAIGFPAELYKGSLSIQAFPVALRLFEKTWGNLVEGNNDFIAWLLKRVSRHFMWGEVTGELRSVTLADDIERKALMFQAAAGQDISKGTAYKPLNIDYVDEQKKVIKEQEVIQKLQQEAMERQQAMQGQQGGAQQGGQPGGDPNAPMQPGATPGDVYEQGKQLAQQMLFQTPPTMRRGELIKIKQSNPTLHAIVMQEMDVIRNDMSRQGQAAMMQQAQQSGSGQKAAEAYDTMPSPFLIGLLISDQVTEYNRKDLQKIAMDIRDKIYGASTAFHFVYDRLGGAIQ